MALVDQLREMAESEEPLIYIGEEFQRIAPEVLKSVNQNAAARSILQAWVDKQGHERCWYYPDLFRQLAALYGVVPKEEPGLPPIEEFKAGCAKYQAEEYSEPA